MTRWQIFLETAEICTLPIGIVLLLASIAGLIWEVIRG